MLSDGELIGGTTPGMRCGQRLKLLDKLHRQWRESTMIWLAVVGFHVFVGGKLINAMSNFSAEVGHLQPATILSPGGLLPNSYQPFTDELPHNIVLGFCPCASNRSLAFRSVSDRLHAHSVVTGANAVVATRHLDAV